MGESFVDISRIFASSSFLFVYSGILVLITVTAIVRNHISIISETKLSRDIIKLVDAAHSLDALGKVAQLLLLNESTGARILTHDACRRDDLGEYKGSCPRTWCSTPAVAEPLAKRALHMAL